MKLKRLKIDNFTAFEDVELEFTTGVNLFVGENDAGKSRVPKLLYAVSEVMGKGGPPLPDPLRNGPAAGAAQERCSRCSRAT